MKQLLAAAFVMSLAAAPARAGHRVGLVTIWIPKSDAHAQSALFDRARDWYRDALEFEVVSDMRGDFDGVAGRWVELQMPGQSGLRMVLKAGIPVTTDTSFTVTPAGVDELCRFHERLKRRGALDPQYPVPVRRPWALEFRVIDPFGQKIVINIPNEELLGSSRQDCG